MVDLVKKVRKMLQNVAIFWLFLRHFVAILAIRINKIGYFGLSTVGNTDNMCPSNALIPNIFFSNTCFDSKNIRNDFTICTAVKL